MEFEVVVPTLDRASLPDCLDATHLVLGKPTIHVQRERGIQLGTIRNIGLKKCRGNLVVFIDDDVILNKAWLEKCLKALDEDSNLIMVQGVVPEGETCGCMIVRRKEFVAGGGFPELDSYVNRRFEGHYKVVRDAVCFHYARGFGLIRHALKWIMSFYQTEFRAGIYHDPKESLRNLAHYIWYGPHEMIFYELAYMVKTFFVLPFIIEDKMNPLEKTRRRTK